MPIPTNRRSETTYGDLGYGEIVSEITKNRLTGGSLCHHDPMFEDGRCAFGQTHAAQGHLRNNDVSVGDIFLFYGLYSTLGQKDRHHRIFAYMTIDEVIGLGGTPTSSDQPKGFTRRHPHTLGEWNPNNTLYIGSGACAQVADIRLRLTHPDGPPTRWVAPKWLHDTGLTYHSGTSWQPDGTLRSASKGQEFVANISGNRTARNWLKRTIKTIEEES